MSNINFIKVSLFSSIAALIINGCGGGSNPSTSSNNIYGTAQLGNLANATVKIYALDTNGSPLLKWTETTSSDTTLEKIGKFNAHTNELKKNTFYLYQVSKGDDWDANDDGVKDTNPTTNNGTIRAIALGSDIIKAGNKFKVTFASEILYEHIAKSLKYDFDPHTFNDILDHSAGSIIIGSSDNDDIILFDPVQDQDLLQNNYTNVSEIIHQIHQGRFPFLSISSNIGSTSTPADATDVKLAYDGTYAYVTYSGTSHSGLQVVQIEDPTSPVTMNTLSIPGAAMGISVSPDSSKSYIASVQEGLQIVNTTPSNFNIQTSYNTIGWAASVTLSKDGKTAFVADGGSGMEIIDVSFTLDPMPMPISSIDTSGFARRIVLSNDGTKALVADESSGLQIIDISDIYHPVFIGNIATSDKTWGAAISKDGTTAYVADGEKGLKIVNISEPSNPIVLSHFNTSGDGFNIVLSSDEKKAYIADGEKGLQIIDVTDLSNPFLIGSIDTSGIAYNIVLSSDETKVYIADGKNGLQIIDVTILDPHI